MTQTYPNALALHAQLLAKYKSLTTKHTGDNIYYYSNRRLVAMYNLPTKTGTTI